tara:strand:+ start:476 stop:664 length:189 start_codon:yes stop_codon:yes gene_type:complete
MVFKVARLRVKELAEVLKVESSEIIATCTVLNIPASSPLSSLSVEHSKEIINFIQNTNKKEI